MVIVVKQNDHLNQESPNILSNITSTPREASKNLLDYMHVCTLEYIQILCRVRKAYIIFRLVMILISD